LVSEVVGSSKMIRPGVAMQRLGDFHQLALARSERIDAGVGLGV
jgi:hypothetical protein